MSADDRGIHNASCEIRTPCVQLNDFTNIHLLILRFINSLCVMTIKLKYTDSCLIPNDVGWGIYLCMCFKL